MKRVLIFFPHNLFPPRSGAHQRCAQMMQGFHALGAEVTLASSTYTSETLWRAVTSTELQTAGISQLRIHQSTIWDRRYVKYMHKLYQTLHRQPPLDSFHYAPPGLRRWFQNLVQELEPHVIIVNYAFWGGLINAAMQKSSVTVMDTLDLVSLYRPRFLVMEQYLPPPPISPFGIDPKFLREDFFDAFDFRVSAQEFAIFDRFRYTIAITRADAELVSKNTSRTRVLTIPMTQEICALDNQYDGAALFTPGRNPFNIQGYLYFAARVLPRVLESEPNFCLHVTGAVCDDLRAVPGIALRGFLPDLLSEYTHARFLICPILGKTGQQIKIVQAMAHGVPVIATRAAAEGSPIRHGENGLVARDANEFAEHVLTLWRDRALCQTMGQAARETIAREFSQTLLVQQIAPLLDG